MMLSAMEYYALRRRVQRSEQVLREVVAQSSPSNLADGFLRTENRILEELKEKIAEYERQTPGPHKTVVLPKYGPGK